MSECPFCNCAERTLLENTHAFVLLSNPLKVENHLLIMPKRHVEKPWELSADERADIFALINELQPRLVEKYGGCDVRQNCRPFLPQSRLSVKHVHYHLIPRSMEDELYRRVEQFETEMFREASEEDRTSVHILLQDISATDSHTSAPTAKCD